MDIKKIALFAAGTLFGSAGFKLLSSKDAKKVYTQTTAAVLRMKDSTMETVSKVQEQAGDILAVQQYLAGGGPLNAHDQFGQGGFSAAVGAGDHCDLAAGHGEAEVIQDGGFPAIGDVEGEIFYFKHKKLLVFQGLVQVGDRPRFLEKAGDQPAI